jgi:hypothetical protein
VRLGRLRRSAENSAIGFSVRTREAPSELRQDQTTNLGRHFRGASAQFFVRAATLFALRTDRH